jgi:hypothetical protein
LDSEFLKEIREAREIRVLPAHMRRIARLGREDASRMGVLMDVMQTWIAIADAASHKSGPNMLRDQDVLNIARIGATACREAMIEGGEEPVLRTAEALKKFLK